MNFKFSIVSTSSPHISYVHVSQCGYSTAARKLEQDKRSQMQGHAARDSEWQRKTPYDFTGCLAHMDITYCLSSLDILRITGIMTHNTACKAQHMTRLPPVPLHDHVWEVALQQLNDGAR